MENNNIEKQIIIELIYLDNKEILSEAIILLEGINFEDQDYYQIYTAIRTLLIQNKEIDLISIYHTCQNVDLKKINTLSFTEIINPNLLMHHIEILKDREYKKELLKRINKSLPLIISGQSSVDLDEIRNSLIADLSTLSKEDKAEFESIKEHKKKIEEQLNSKSNIEGYSWGIQDLDLWTSGIMEPRVYVIGGLKKSGKTRFLIHLIKSLHNQKVRTIFLSMEMPGYEVTKLLHASFTGLNDLRFRSSSILKAEEYQMFKEVEIDETVFALECKSGLKLDQVLSRIRRFSRMGFKVILIDYIQRIAHDRNKQAQELEDISIKLADSARQNNVALILLSQLNALGEREVPNMGHLKGSGGIGEAADVIFLFDNLYRRTKDENDRNKIDIYIEQRHGDSGRVELWADLGSCRFNNLATAHQLEEYHSKGEMEEIF